MVEWLQVWTLALIQGLSEFLPISSSAHLVLPSRLLGWPDQGLLFDVAVHVGTLLAVVLYFWRDVLGLLADIYPPLRRTGDQPGLLWRLVVATVPAVIAGLLLSETVEHYLRGLPVIATTTIVFGLLLGWSTRYSHPAAPADAAHVAEAEHVSWRDACLIGLAQVAALVPGVSRSGITITAALFLGYSPVTAARFSFLLSMPVIVGAMTFMGMDLLGESPAMRVAVEQLLVAMLVAGLSAYTTIALFIALLARVGMMPFVWYRLGLGAVLIIVILLEGS